MNDLSMMVCSGCGTKIPILGKVCPHCQRDKTEDAERHARVVVFGMLFGATGALIGFLFGNDFIEKAIGCFVGLLIGAIVGSITGLITARTPTANAPPEFRLAREVSLENGSDKIDSHAAESRLAQLESLRRKGLISEVEYSRKREEILGSI